MWYLSVDMQAFVITAVLLYLLRRNVWAQIAALTSLLAVLTWWRLHVSDVEPIINVLLRTSARMDAFVVGVLLGAVLSVLGDRRLPGWTGIAATAALLPLVWICSDDERFISYGVTLLELDLAVLVAAIVVAARPPQLRGLGVLTFLGRHSLPLYVWHYPAFAAVEQHTRDWNWLPRSVLAFGIVAILCVLTHRLVEENVSRLLVHPGWARLRPHGDEPTADPRPDELAPDDLALPADDAPTPLTAGSVGPRV